MNKMNTINTINTKNTKSTKNIKNINLPNEIINLIMSYHYRQTPTYISIKYLINEYEFNIPSFINPKPNENYHEDDNFKDWCFNKIYLEKIKRQSKKFHEKQKKSFVNYLRYNQDNNYDNFYSDLYSKYYF
jgi:hypothetical protein